MVTDDQAWPEPQFERRPALTLEDLLFPIVTATSVVVIFAVAHFAYGVDVGRASLGAIILGIAAGVVAELGLLILKY